MRRNSVICVRVVALSTLLWLPAPLVFGQGTGIAGVVKDTSGAVLPGVTVGASSPALIEKVRTVVTDGQGLYSITELRPGVYTVNFVLPGFSTVKREAIMLTTGFTAVVNAEMAVGALDETITVVGESPIVDTRTVRQTSIVTDRVIEALPTGRTTTGLATLMPGIQIGEGGLKFQDVGGLAGEGNNFLIHGSRHNDGHWLINGLPFHSTRLNQAVQRPDVSQVEEFALETSAISAEYSEGGVTSNLVGKEGSNQFSGSAFASYAGDKMQGNNFDDELRARGVAAINSLKRNYDYSVNTGGPIKKDRLWFFAGIRHWGTDNLLAGVFDDANRRDFLYTPDLSKQALWIEDVTNLGVRMTWQATSKNKVQGYVQKQKRIGFVGLATTMPEAQSIRSAQGPGYLYSQLSWSSPVTPRLLLEAGHAYLWEMTRTDAIEGLPTDSPNWGYNIVDSNLGIQYNYPSSIARRGDHHNQNYRASVSYVTGSHTFKTGWQTQTAVTGPTFTELPRDMTLLFVNRVPSRITLQVSPRFTRVKLNQATGLYVTDRWTRQRLTLNLGLRFDYNNGSVPAQDQPAGRFLPARHFDEVTNVPNWKDLSPRLGVVYDLFGNGKTALKASLSRYLAGGNTTATANAFNPVATTVNNANRNWTDLNGNFLPDCPNLLSPVANGECTGPLGNLNFGTNVISTTRDPAIVQGWGVRGYNWETSAVIQQELTPRVGLNVGYYHRQYGNFQVTDNIRVTPADYDPYCITTPIDPRLPGGGGQELCGYYDINPTKAGQTFNHVTKAENFGKQEDVFDGVDISITSRLGGGLLVQAGTATGRQRTNTCFTVDSPQATLDTTNGLPATPGSGPRAICDVRPPFQTQAKLLATVPLPGGVQLAGTFQTSPGPQITATYVARSIDILPSLGRHLSSGPTGTASVEIIPPGTLYGPRVYQLDARVTKIIPLGRFRLQGNFDAFNIFNANPVLQQSNNYGTNGATWLRPEGQSGVLNARMFKVSALVRF
jgi:hypothetical protein